MTRAAEGLIVTVVADEPLGVLMAAGHRLAAVEQVEWAELAGEELLWFRRDLAPGYHDAILTVCHRNGWQPRLRVASARRSIVSAELAGGAVALRPQRDAARESGLTWRPLATDEPRLRWALVHPRDTRHLALAQLATDLAR